MTPVSRHIFVNVQGTRELVEIDPVTATLLARLGRFRLEHRR
jgi:hypothetical protein